MHVACCVVPTESDFLEPKLARPGARPPSIGMGRQPGAPAPAPRRMVEAADPIDRSVGVSGGGRAVVRAFLAALRSQAFVFFV